MTKPENPDHPDATLNPDQGIAIFTDGSCWTGDRIGGWAWVAVDAYNGCDWDSGYWWDTTISQMELCAVSSAMAEMDNRYGDQDLLIFSDSEYVVLGYNQRETRRRNTNHDFWSMVFCEASHHRSVTLEHVRGHDGTEGNELADQLAGKARKEGQVYEERKYGEKGEYLKNPSTKPIEG